MDLYREQSIIIGILYLLVFTAGIFSVSNVVDSSEYLSKSAAKPKQVIRAAGFQLLMAVFYSMIIFFLYPIIKVYSWELAIGFISFRILAVIFALLGTYILFTILNISRKHVSNPEHMIYLSKGDQLRFSRDMANHVGMIITLSLGSIALYLILYQSELIPSWLSIWGIIGGMIAIFASMLVLVKSIKIKSKAYILLNLPMAVQEITFGIWLIVVGFQIQ